MWPKDDYQEHMLGYIDGVRVGFERLLYPHLQQDDLNEFYTNLDITSEYLWRLIEASDADWEGYRYPLEASCDELLRAFHRLPRAGSWIFSVSLTITENHETISQSWKPAEMLR